MRQFFLLQAQTVWASKIGLIRLIGLIGLSLRFAVVNRRDKFPENSQQNLFLKEFYNYLT